jgi:hypothetical protein
LIEQAQEYPTTNTCAVIFQPTGMNDTDFEMDLPIAKPLGIRASWFSPEDGKLRSNQFIMG